MRVHSQRSRPVRPQRVLSLAKLAGVDQRYHLEQAERRVDHAESVSTGAEDYYLAGPEAAGHWTGSAATALRLSGEVTESGLRAIRSKHDPVTGKKLEGSVLRARVPGFDLMFSVPKSASILFGIGDEATQRAVLDAQAEAVRSALAYLEQRNGANDSCAPPLIKAVRAIVRDGHATSAAVGVAALRAGWCPDKVMGLVAKVRSR